MIQKIKWYSYTAASVEGMRQSIYIIPTDKSASKLSGLQYKFCITKATLTAHFDWNGNEFEHQTQLLCCLFFLSLLLSAVRTALWTGHVPYIYSRLGCIGRCSFLKGVTQVLCSTSLYSWLFTRCYCKLKSGIACCHQWILNSSQVPGTSLEDK